MPLTERRIGADSSRSPKMMPGQGMDVIGLMRKV
jgi:hypothetical protein